MHQKKCPSGSGPKPAKAAFELLAFLDSLLRLRKRALGTALTLPKCISARLLLVRNGIIVRALAPALVTNVSVDQTGPENPQRVSLPVPF
jgi:hypothetical protein